MPEDHSTLLTTILTPTWWKEREDQLFSEVLTPWDVLISQYQTETGEAITQSMRASTVLAHAPKDVREFLQSGAREVRTEYALMRKAIRDFVLGKRGASYVPSRSTSA